MHMFARLAGVGKADLYCTQQQTTFTTGLGVTREGV
jgi:hypothetical protein